MTYCVGLFLKDGLVLLSDTRTNAGVDNISTFRKMFIFEKAGDRAIVAMTSGNLAASQAVMNLIEEGVLNPETGEIETIYTVPSMFRAAELVGNTVRRVYRETAKEMEAQGVNFEVSILLGGQLKGRTLRLFQVYSAGNFISATDDTPFLQIGEVKYGKPILDRTLTHDTSIGGGIKLVLVSMDSTLRSNLSVGMPIDLAVIRRDSLAVTQRRRITAGDPYFSMIRETWSNALRAAYQAIPDPDWIDQIS
jgi:putative proteasome-type protease